MLSWDAVQLIFLSIEMLSFPACEAPGTVAAMKCRLAKHQHRILDYRYALQHQENCRRTYSECARHDIPGHLQDTAVHALRCTGGDLEE